jgi:hypothetical protein
MKKEYKYMNYEEKILNLTQCQEAGYTFVAGCNPIANLITGLETDPDWFDFSVKEDDYDNLALIFAGVLASDIVSDFNDTIFEILNEKTVTDTVKSFIYSTYKEKLPCTEADCVEMLDDLYNKLCYHFDTNAFRCVPSKNIEDFLENAECGSKSEIDGTTFYKVRNTVDGEPYAVYFDDAEELKIV